MQNDTIKLFALSYKDVRTYYVASLFVIGNIVLPQIFHLVPKGGMVWLPIYFFTLVGAYKYGWKAGLLTAIFSPIINSLLFGMPMPSALPAILLKSILLALAAGYVAHRFQKASLPLLALTILSYQIVGTSGEWAMTGDLAVAMQDFRIGIPGMLLQIFGGYAFINYFIRNRFIK